MAKEKEHIKSFLVGDLIRIDAVTRVPKKEKYYPLKRFGLLIMSGEIEDKKAPNGAYHLVYGSIEFKTMKGLIRAEKALKKLEDAILEDQEGKC